MTNTCYTISARLKSNGELVYFGFSGGWTRLINNAYKFKRQADANVVALLAERDYLVSTPIAHKHPEHSTYCPVS